MKPFIRKRFPKTQNYPLKVFRNENIMHPSAVPALVLDWECVIPPQGFVGGEVLILLWYVFALAVPIDWHERDVALDATSRCKVNFEPKTVTAGRAGHTAQGRRFTRRHARVSVKRDLEGDSSRGRAGGGMKCVVSLTEKTNDHFIFCESMKVICSTRPTVEFRYQPFFFGPSPNAAIHVGHGGRPLKTCFRHREVCYWISPWSALVSGKQRLTHTHC